jgi:hypothetical protein
MEEIKIVVGMVLAATVVAVGLFILSGATMPVPAF